MEWISVEDRLPEPGERVIGVIGRFSCEMYIDNAKVWYRLNRYEVEDNLGKVTHWMTMPKLER